MVMLRNAAFIVALCFSFSQATFAALGDKVTTVATDRAQMMAQRGTQSAPSYTVEELRLPGGTLVREYVNPAGIVFGVTWQGPEMPDLAQLLGTYMDEARTGVKAFREKHGGVGPVAVSSGGLVLQAGGHMGQYRGRAYLPAAIPASVTVEAIQ
ncbi:DUF2844 domain-containing protein [Paraburkholderia flagellata]|uniref:DUF2844 domain-containing protein n=1 Tax=Paraburkholderia flagellata TaxID=2883241 RepID=UPI001F1E2312|nr:DUF2844 domain-containing protein [Paraburkholderia flagellata]